MKQILFFIFIIMSSTIVVAQQNLIINPGFEISGCGISNFYGLEVDSNNVIGWNNGNYQYTTPDFFRQGCLPYDSNFPNFTGVSKLGLWLIAYSYVDTIVPNRQGSREPVMGKLITKLKANSRYCFNVHIYYLIDSSINFTNNCLVDFQLKFLKIPKLNIVDSINLGSIITDADITIAAKSYEQQTSKWTKISSMYQARGDETYFYIGNFQSVEYLKLHPPLKIPNTDTSQLLHSYVVLDEFSLTEIITPKTFSEKSDSFICATNGSATITINDNLSFGKWNTGDSSKSITVHQAGKYWVEVFSDCGTYTDTFEVKEVLNAPIPFSLGNDTTICNEDAIVLSASQLFNYSYLWNTNQTTPYITTQNLDSYICNITNACGNQSDTIVVSKKACNVIIPNAFSPNEDGLNDEFRIISSSFPILNFTIYNRYGNCVFKNNNALFGWDGKYKTTDCPMGTYFYICKYKINNQEKILKGCFELVR